jgi:replication factor C subunit 3/5
MTTIINNSKPWVEKYRPNILNDIVLDKTNKNILNNILKMNYLPNILLHGPPGTGKTTTIINLIEELQILNNNKNKSLIIHLNASDERGIDVIRNQIYQFVNSKNLFVKGVKVIILDEVDYMTKSAQLALKNLLININTYDNIRFCLICNYISRIDESLQNIFIKLKFNQLPEENIINFLQNIISKENLTYNNEQLISIQKFYKSDLRSMINHIQLNMNNTKNCGFITDDIFVTLTEHFKEYNNYDKISNYIDNVIVKYYIDINKIIISYLNFVIRNKDIIITKQFLKLVEYITHHNDKGITIKKYFILSLNDYISSL